VCEACGVAETVQVADATHTPKAAAYVAKAADVTKATKMAQAAEREGSCGGRPEG